MLNRPDPGTICYDLDLLKATDFLRPPAFWLLQQVAASVSDKFVPANKS